MLCKDCPHFHIDYPPLNGADFGRASCRKYNLITDFIDKRKFKRLECVDKGSNLEGVPDEVLSINSCQNPEGEWK